MNFLDLVRTAVFQSSDNASRSQAEAQILAMKENNIDQFFLETAQGLDNDSIEPALRQACGTLLKRCISLKNSQGIFSWLLCQPLVKQQVKDSCLRQLVNQNSLIKRSAANAISEICAIELPRNEWPDIVNKLLINSSATDIEVRKSAVLTLGYICESLKNNKTQVISDDENKKILYGICLGLSQSDSAPDPEIQRISIKALQDALDFMQVLLFANAEIRVFVCNVLTNTSMSNDKSIRILALQCLIDFVKQLYDCIGDYLPPILQVTLQSIEHQDVDVAVPAMEVWSVFGNEIKDRIIQSQTQINSQNGYPNQTSPQQSFMIQNFQQLITPFLRNLFVNDQHEDEEAGELTIQEATYRALSALVDVVGHPCHNWLTEFISNNLMQQDWMQRKAAILAFGALSESTENEQIKILIFNALTPLIKTLNDQNNRVKAAGARVLSKVSEHYPECFFNHQESQVHLDILLDALKYKPVISKNVVWVLTFLTEQLQKIGPGNPYIDQKFKILQYLASIAVRNDLSPSHYSVIDTCFMGILNVVYSISDAKLCKSYLSEFHTKLLDAESYEDERKKHIQSGLLTCMHGCLMRLSPQDLEDQEVNSLNQTFIQFVQDANLNSDSLYAMSGLACCLRQKFAPYAQQLLPHLNGFLQNVDTQETFKTSLFCLADIARGLEDQFVQYLGVVDYLISLIHNPGFDREMKIQVYICIADIALGTKEKCKPYLEKLIQLVKVGFQGCVVLTKQGEPDSLDYADRLKEQLMQYYTCLMHAFCDGSSPFQPLYETLPWLFEFAETTCDRKLRPTVEFVRLTLNAILDAGNFFHKTSQSQDNDQVQRYLTSNFVIDLIQTIGKFSQQPENLECYSYATELLKSQFGYSVPQLQN